MHTILENKTMLEFPIFTLRIDVIICLKIILKCFLSDVKEVKDINRFYSKLNYTVYTYFKVQLK